MSKWIGGGMMLFAVIGIFNTGDIEGAGALFIFGALVWGFWDGL
jgi:hypothetical protein